MTVKASRVKSVQDLRGLDDPLARCAKIHCAAKGHHSTVSGRDSWHAFSAGFAI